MKNDLTYTKALDELKQIVRELENELVSIDDLSSKVKRASELLEFCRSKLKDTRQDLSDD